jgi:hypothetical protein
MLDPRYRLLDVFRDAFGRFQSRLDWRLDRLRRRLGMPDRVVGGLDWRLDRLRRRLGLPARVGGGGAGTRRVGRGAPRPGGRADRPSQPGPR